MTCIVGVEKGNTVWLGGDSAGTNGALGRTIIKDPKVFVKGDVAFGVCGLPKVMDAIRHAIELPVQDKGDTDRAFLVSTLVPALRDGLKKLDCCQKEGEETVFEGAVLIGYRGKVYNMQGNFQLIHSADGYASVGSGSTLALGSLDATKGQNPKKRVLAALRASTKNAGCAPPFVVVTVKKSLW